MSRVSLSVPYNSVSVYLSVCLLAHTHTRARARTAHRAAIRNIFRGRYRSALASLGLVSPGAATDGVTLFFFLEKTDDLFLVIGLWKVMTF